MLQTPQQSHISDELVRTRMSAASDFLDDEDSGVLDSEMVKLYYSILSGSQKKASVQDIKNRTLISGPVVSLAVLAGDKSRPKTPFYESRESPISKRRPTNSSIKYVYLSQSKPRPMKPLKAWRGYNGNLYFEPITINPCKQSENDNYLQHRTHTTFPSINSIIKSSNNKTQSGRVPWIDSQQHQNPALQLEKEAVLSRLSMSLTDDLEHISENLGTLRMATMSPVPAEKPKSSRKPHIYKGSVVHQLYLKADRKVRSKSSYGFTNSTKGKPPSARSTLVIANTPTRTPSYYRQYASALH